MRRTCLAFLCLAAALAPARAAEPPTLELRLAGAPQTVFTPARDACDGNDVPDIPVRAFRDAAGGVVMYGLHYVNRAFRGPDLDHLKLDCRIVLDSHGDPDPAHFDDRTWIAAVFTRGGKTVEALAHHEFQANEHKGRCKFAAYIQCWWNSVVALRSTDSGASFARSQPPKIAAAAPFRSEAEQGRHRGFFNPSNIFDREGRQYFFAGTTGWAGQDAGVCLFRADDPAKGGWRAWDGAGFSAAFPDPYRAKTSLLTHCATIAPFPAPVGAVVEHRPSQTYLAVFQASRDQKNFPTAGIYYATSKNLLAWSLPRLLIAGATNYDDPCASGGKLLAYPSLLDSGAKSRVFADAGAEAWLYFASLKVEGCAITPQRDLLRVRVGIAAGR